MSEHLGRQPENLSAPNLDGVFMIPSSEGGMREMVVSEVVRDLDGSPTEITFMATDGSGDTKKLNDIATFLANIDAFRKPETDPRSEKVQREMGDRALAGNVSDPSELTPPEPVSEASFPGMFDPSYSEGLSQQQVADRAAVRAEPTEAEQLASERSVQDAKDAAGKAYKRPEMN